MPVIRIKPEATTLPPERRRKLVEQLSQELAGGSTPGHPVIFEIPLDQRDAVDVFVIWHEWENVSWEDRESIIREAYGSSAERVGQPLGATFEEAMQQRLLPYAIVSAVLENPKHLEKMKLGVERERVYLEDIRKLMLEAGGIKLPNGRIELRFPTRAMADSALERLRAERIDGYWSPPFTPE
jgi:hypothetical protein